MNCFSCFSGGRTTASAFVMMLSILARLAWRCNYRHHNFSGGIIEIHLDPTKGRTMKSGKNIVPPCMACLGNLNIMPRYPACLPECSRPSLRSSARLPQLAGRYLRRRDVTLPLRLIHNNTIQYSNSQSISCHLNDTVNDSLCRNKDADSPAVRACRC